MIFNQATSGHLLESKAVELSLAAEAESSTRPGGRSWRADDWRVHVGEKKRDRRRNPQKEAQALVSYRKPCGSRSSAVIETTNSGRRSRGSRRDDRGRMSPD